MKKEQEIIDKNQAIETIKPIFEKYNSFSKDHGILKSELSEEINEENKKQFQELLNHGIIKKAKGKFYYDLSEEETPWNKKKGNKKIKIILTAIISLIIIIAIAAAIIFAKKSNKEVTDGTLKFKINTSWTQYTNMYNGGWNYYKYINTKPVEDSNTIESDDYSHEPAYISIAYQQLESGDEKSIEERKQDVTDSIDKLQDKPNESSVEIDKTAKEYDVIKIKIKYNEDPQTVEYLYYIYTSDYVISIDAYSFTFQDEEALQKNIENIINSIEVNAENK